MSDRDNLSYLAGLFDGEGCFYSCRSKNGQGRLYHHPQMIISNNNKEVMDWLQTNYGGYVYARQYHNKSWKTTYQWSIDGKKAIALAERIRPLLIIKKDEVDKLHKKD